MTGNRTRLSLILLLDQVITALLLAALPAAAQDQLQAALSLKGQPKAGEYVDSPRVEPSPQPASKDRLFYTLPNFLTVESTAKRKPLTTQQKFKLVARNTFDYAEFPWYGLRAGIGQAQNSEPGYGQGAAGYAKRFAATSADCAVENFMAGAVFPSLLHQDPRFYRSAEGTVWRRAGYAVSRVFVTRSDSGRRQFNFSEILGSALAAGISTYSYHTAQDRTLRNAATVWESQVAFHTLTIVMKEFWPDLRRKISQTRHRAAPME